MKLHTNVSLRHGVLSAGASLAVLVAIPAACWGQTPPAAVDVLKADIDAVIAAKEGGADRQIKVVDVGKLNVGVGVLQMGKKPNDGKPITGIAHAQVTEVYYVLSGSGVLITGTRDRRSPRRLRPIRRSCRSRWARVTAPRSWAASGAPCPRATSS